MAVFNSQIPSDLSTEVPTNNPILQDNTLRVATLNIRGQTGLDIPKQKQIESFIKQYNLDILHCQEI